MDAQKRAAFYTLHQFRDDLTAKFVVKKATLPRIFRRQNTNRRCFFMKFCWKARIAGAITRLFFAPNLTRGF
ncbi:hypothetical protein ACFQAT_11220 [Undibacterium arcticum]|uniref:hypothetical protein n=1 Tax=Undibacterium arcticum TaxID=1762892 RepID=UPI00361EC789